MSETDDKDTIRSGISARAMILGVILVIAVSLIVSYAELVTARILIGSQQLPPAVIAIFALIVLANKGLRRLSQRLGLTGSELTMIYCMMLLSALVSARGIVEKLLPMLVTSNYFADPSNRWHELYAPNIKRWLVPFDVGGLPHQFASRGYFEGLRQGEHIPWNLWITPLTAWGILCLLIVFGFLCLASILRAQWSDHERLSFPLAQPALELIREEGTLFRNRLLWAGFAIPVLMYGLNGMAGWYPNIPIVLVSFGIWPMKCYLSFAGIGLAFLLPSDIIFSLWFFYAFAELQGAVAWYYGRPTDWMPMYPCFVFVGYQVAGAYFALSAYMAYSARDHLRKVARAFIGRASEDDANELIPYRVAVWGLATCFVLSVIWCVVAGMSLWLAVMELGVFMFVVAVVMARSTAGAGLFMTETSFRPVDLYRMFAPVHTLGPTNLTMMAFLDGAFMRDQRGLVLTGFFDSLKISDGSAVRRRSLLPGYCRRAGHGNRRDNAGPPRILQGRTPALRICHAGEQRLGFQ